MNCFETEVLYKKSQNIDPTKLFGKLIGKSVRTLLFIEKYLGRNINQCAPSYILNIFLWNYFCNISSQQRRKHFTQCEKRVDSMWRCFFGYCSININGFFFSLNTQTLSSSSCSSSASGVSLMPFSWWDKISVEFWFFWREISFFCSPVAAKLPSAPLSLAAGRWGGVSHWKKSRPEPRPRPEIRKSYWCTFQRMFHQRRNFLKKRNEEQLQKFRQRLCSSPNIHQCNVLTPDNMCGASLDMTTSDFFCQGLKGRPGPRRDFQFSKSHLQR